MTARDRAEKWIRDEPASSSPVIESLAAEFDAVRRQAREEAALLCDARAGWIRDGTAGSCARAIRRLSPKEQP